MLWDKCAVDSQNVLDICLGLCVCVAGMGWGMFVCFYQLDTARVTIENKPQWKTCLHQIVYR